MSSTEDVASDHESTSSSDPEDEEEIRKRVQSLVTGRERRSNAGAKMQGLLSNLQETLAAEDNDFYNSTYGGFNEEEGDDDFASDQEEADDELDSDFDADESQIEGTEETGEGEEDETKKSRRGKKVKLAYEISAQNRARKEEQKKMEAKKMEAKKEVKPRPSIPVKRPLDKPPPVHIDEKRVLRTRISKKDDDDEYEPTKRRRRGGSRRGRKKAEEDVKVWTQEELLKEAKKTEIENLKSLEKYQLLELEKLESKKRLKRTERKVPSSFIRYVSTSMPLVEEGKSPSKRSQESRVGRTFITFSDDHAFDSAFPSLKKAVEKAPSVPGVAPSVPGAAPSVPGVGSKRSTIAKMKRGEAVCPISHLRARYFDPVTQLPFASSTTFRALREAYGQQLELFYGKVLRPEGVKTEEGPALHAKTLAKLKSDGVLDWLEYRKEMKKQQVTPVTVSSGS